MGQCWLWGYRRLSQGIGTADPPLLSSRSSSSTSTRFTPARPLSSAVTKVSTTSSPLASIQAQWLPHSSHVSYSRMSSTRHRARSGPPSSTTTNYSKASSMAPLRHSSQTTTATSRTISCLARVQVKIRRGVRQMMDRWSSTVFTSVESQGRPRKAFASACGQRMGE